MWRSLLQQYPQIVSNDLGFSAQLRIPDAFYQDALASEEGIAGHIMALSSGVAMTSAIRLHHEARFRAIEIKCVCFIGMLSSKLVTCKTFVAEHTPENFLGPSGFQPEASGAGDLLLGWLTPSPHPGPLPIGWGEGVGVAVRMPCCILHAAGCR
jgi:hypothetical protein